MTRSFLKEIGMQKNKLQTLLTDESGVTAIEYGLLASGIAMAIVLVVNSVGSALEVFLLTCSRDCDWHLITLRRQALP